MKNSNKKRGFTIVELIIVIAVIAILAAVLIPTFSSLINKSLVAADESLVRNLNEALAMDVTNPHNTMTDALKATKENGFDVSKINARASTDGQKHEILWDSRNDCFVYKKGNDINYIPKSNTKGDATRVELWHIANKGISDISSEYSNYLAAGTYAATLDITTGLDVGEHKEVTKVNYTNTNGNQDVVIRTNSGILTVGSPSEVAKGQIRHYGVLDNAIIYTETSCFHTNGAIGKMELKAGKAIAENGGIVYLVEAKGNDVAVEENGGKFIIPAGVTSADVLTSVVESIGYTEATVVGGTYDNSKRDNAAYEIRTLAELENFRDLVNGGFSFAGCKVELKADITLKDGWTPIGEGNRAVAATNYQGNYAGDDASAKVFKGEFDGGNHTISNLNNINYSPRFTCEMKSGGNEYQYSFGFFGILYQTAKVYNLTFDKVNIDVSIEVTDVSGNKCKGDSVAALVGYCDGNISVSGITVKSGSIKGTDAVAGVIGRWYNVADTISLNKLENNASITATAAGGKAAGLVGFVSKSNNNIFKFKACKNNADVSSTNEQESYSDHFMCYANFGKNNALKSGFTFDQECTVSGNCTVSCPSTKGEMANQYGVWRWTH